MTPPWPKPGKKGKTIGQRSRQAVSDLREQLLVRDGYACVCTGLVGQDGIDACHGPLTVQHRVGRGAGGSAHFDLPGYLLIMCAWHNVLAERDADFSAVCVTNGWSIPRRNWAVVEPDRVPVLYRDSWYELRLETCWRLPISLEQALRMKALVS